MASSAKPILREVRVGNNPVAIDRWRWSLLGVSSDNSFLIQDFGEITSRRDYRCRRAYVSLGRTAQILSDRNTIIGSLSTKIKSSAPLPGGNFACLIGSKSLRIYDRAGKLSREVTLAKNGSIIASRLHEGASQILVCEDKAIRIMNATTLIQEGSFPIDDSVLDMVPMADGSILLRKAKSLVVLKTGLSDHGKKQTVSTDKITVKKCLEGPDMSTFVFFVREKSKALLEIALLDDRNKIQEGFKIHKFNSVIQKVHAAITSSGTLLLHVMTKMGNDVYVGRVEFQTTKRSSSTSVKRLFLDPEINLWNISINIPVESYEKLGQHLGFTKEELGEMKTRLDVFPEVTFAMLAAWVQRSKTDDPINLGQDLTDVLKKSDLWQSSLARKAPEDPYEYVCKSDEGRNTNYLSNMQLLYLAEEIMIDNIVPVTLRLGLTYIELTKTRREIPRDVTHQMYNILNSWRDGQEAAVDQTKTMTNILRACGFRKLANQIEHGHLEIDESTGQVKLADYERSSPVQGKSVKTTFEIQHKNEKINEMAKDVMRPAVTKAKQKWAKVFRCLQAVRCLQRSAKDKENGEYSPAAISVEANKICVQVNTYTERGLDKLKADVESGKIQRDLKKVLIPAEEGTASSKGVGDFDVKVNKASYEEAKSFYKALDNIPLDTLHGISQETGPYNLEKLCTALCLNPDEWRGRFVGAGRTNYQETAKQMLLKWKNTSNEVTSVFLREALKNAGLKRLAEKYLTFNVSVFESKADVPTRVLKAISLDILTQDIFMGMGIALEIPHEDLVTIYEDNEGRCSDAAYQAIDMWRNKTGVNNRYLLSQVFNEAGLSRITTNFLTEDYSPRHMTRQLTPTALSEGNYVLNERTTSIVNDVIKNVDESSYTKLGLELEIPRSQVDGALYSNKNNFQLATKFLLAEWTEGQGAGCDEELLNAFKKLGLL